MLFVRAGSGGFEATVPKSLSRAHPSAGWTIVRGRLGDSGRRYISSQKTCGRILEKKEGANSASERKTVYLYVRSSPRYTYIIYYIYFYKNVSCPRAWSIRFCLFGG